MKLQNNRLKQKELVIYSLPIVEFREALQFQKNLVQAKIAGKIPDVLLLLEHPVVLTIGRFGNTKDIIVPTEILAREGIPIIRTDRGGSVTFHGPGQLVGYPIINLKEHHLSLSQYIWNLEEVVIIFLRDLGIKARRVSNYPGVWVNEEKICSIGLHYKHHICRHGFALNVNNSLHYFDYINPCGINNKTITSVSNLLNREITVDKIKPLLIRTFIKVFKFKTKEDHGSYQCLIASDSQNG